MSVGWLLDPKVVDFLQDILFVKESEEGDKGRVLIGDVYLVHLILLFAFEQSFYNSEFC